MAHLGSVLSPRSRSESGNLLWEPPLAWKKPPASQPASQPANQPTHEGRALFCAWKFPTCLVFLRSVVLTCRAPLQPRLRQSVSQSSVTSGNGRLCSVCSHKEENKICQHNGKERRKSNQVTQRSIILSSVTRLKRKKALLKWRTLFEFFALGIFKELGRNRVLV